MEYTLLIIFLASVLVFICVYLNLPRLEQYTINVRTRPLPPPPISPPPIYETDTLPQYAQNGVILDNQRIGYGYVTTI